MNEWYSAWAVTALDAVEKYARDEVITGGVYVRDFSEERVDQLEQVD